MRSGWIVVTDTWYNIYLFVINFMDDKKPLHACHINSYVFDIFVSDYFLKRPLVVCKWTILNENSILEMQWYYLDAVFGWRLVCVIDGSIWWSNPRPLSFELSQWEGAVRPCKILFPCCNLPGFVWKLFLLKQELLKEVLDNVRFDVLLSWIFKEEKPFRVNPRLRL